MTDSPSYIDYESFLDPSFSAPSFANSLVLSTNNPSDTPLDLSTPLSRVLFDVQEIDSHIHTLTTKSALPLLSHTKTQTEASERILTDVSAQVASLTDGYKRLEKEVTQRYETAEQVRIVAERLWDTVKLGRAVQRCVTLGRQLELQMAELSGGGGGKKEDHRAMVRTATTLLTLGPLLPPSPTAEPGLAGITMLTTLQTDLINPTAATLRNRAQQIVREFSLTTTSSPSSTTSTSNPQAQSQSHTPTYAQTELTKSATVSALHTLYLLSPPSSSSPSPLPSLLTASLTNYLTTALTASTASLSRALANLSTLERTLHEVSARCQNIVALETLLANTSPPALPAGNTSNSTSDSASPEPPSSTITTSQSTTTTTLLHPLLAHLDTPPTNPSPLPSYFWATLASNLAPRVQELLARGGTPARALRASRERVREGVRGCVMRGVKDAVKDAGRKGGADEAKGKGWEREVAVMVGAVVGGLGR
ncbi:MAG: hypothetical protein M1833_002386 [Piccolia ochrophora]|nr:MAG: hypothetical protein M1833_002386 [Piccolia ochrophora]